MTGWRIAFGATAWLFLGGVIVQVFLAGAGLFKLTDWTFHTGLGWVLGSAPIVLLGLAVPARFERRMNGLVIGLTIVTFLQPELAEARKVAPLVAALHPVSALLVFWLAWLVARRSIDEARASWRHGSAIPVAITTPLETAAPAPAVTPASTPVVAPPADGPA